MAGTEGLVRFKIEPPPKYTGKGNFEEFAKRFTNYMSLSNVRYGDLMRKAANNPTPILTARLDSLDEGLEPEGTTRKMASILYYALSGLVDGPAYVLVDQVEDSNGLEAWRLLYQRYASTNTHNAIMTLVALVNTTV